MAPRPIASPRRITLLLPDEMYLRLKTQAMTSRRHEAEIVAEALSAYWGLAAPAPTEAPTPSRRSAPAPCKRGSGDAELLQEVEAALTAKRFSQAQLAEGVGLSSAATFRGWRETGRVPGSHVAAVRAFLVSHLPY